MSSSRLPGKVLKPLLGEPMLSRQIERIRRTSRIDNVIVATSTSGGDDQIEELCNELGVRCFRGSLENVLDRFYLAAEIFSPDYVMRLTGDCPLFDPDLADELIDFFLKGDYDYASNSVEPTFPDGLDMEIMKFSALKTAWKEAKLLTEIEHVTPYISNHSELFRIGSMKNDEDLSAMRWTVDEPADYLFISRIYESLYPGDPCFSWRDVLSYLYTHPEISDLNSSIRRNEGFESSLIKQAKQAVIKLDRVFLRILLPEDVTEKYLGWLNNDRTTRHLVTKSAEMENLKEYVRERYDADDVLFYGIYLRDTGDHIGNVKLEPVDFSKKEAILGILIGESRWRGKGICKEVCNGIAEYSFSILKLEKIFLGVEYENKNAMKCYKSCGFIEMPQNEGNNEGPYENGCIRMVLDNKDLKS